MTTAKNEKKFKCATQHVKALKNRQKYLSDQIRANEAGEAVLSYMCQEWNALDFAIAVIETIRHGGGFKE